MTALVLFALFASTPTCDTPQATAIQAHLDTVAIELAAADTTHLTPAQLANRARHLAVLADYRDACRFPAQTLAPDRLVTVFVDDHDVHCAVGYLMQQDGRADLVAKIRATQNTATIQELGADPEVLTWLTTAGLSPYEAARIQPAYCFMNRGGTCLCADQAGGGAVHGVAEATITAVPQDGSTVQATIARVHGTGLQADDTVTVTRVDGDVVGRAILVVTRDGYETPTETFRGQNVVGDHVSCTSGYMNEGVWCAYVPTSIYIAALRSEDCMSTLAAHDPQLDKSVCALDGAACSAKGLPAQRDEGCATGHASLWLALGALGLVRLASARRSG